MSGSRKFITLVAAIVLAGALVGLGIFLTKPEQEPEQEAVSQNRFAGVGVVVDAGHGGFDVGAIGVAGTYETDLNLSISKKLEALLISEGASVTMTRSGEEAVGEDKDSDMAYRREVIEVSGQDVTISIHQNHYNDPAVSGPQVFFSPGSIEGEKLATSIQDSLNEVLDPPNVRSQVANDYYIVQSGAAPAVIVECGFISNAEEEQLLITEEYQDSIVEAIAQGLEKYLEIKA